MTRGGKREGAGRPTLPEEQKAKNYTFRLYPGEKEKVKNFLKIIRQNNKKEII